MSRLKLNIAASYLGQAWVAVMGLAFIPAYIQFLGMEAYGLIGLFAVMQAWLAVLDAGMSPTLSREMARFVGGAHTPQSIRDLLRTIEVLSLGVAFAIAFVIWTAAGYLSSEWLRAQALPSTTVAQALSIMAVVVGLRLIEGIYRGAMFGLQLQVSYNMATALLATVRHGGAVAVLAWVSPTIQAFFAWQSLISVATVVVLGFFVQRALPHPPHRPRFSRRALLDVWRFAGGVLGITCLAILVGQIDKILLSRLLSLEVFGHYVLAATLAASIQLMVGPITQSVYPRMVELVTAKDEAALSSLYHKGARLVTVVTAPALMLLTFFSEPIVFVWAGNEELARNVSPLLSVLIIGSFLNGVMWIPYQCQLAHGWTKLAMVSNAAAVVVLVPLLAWLAPRYGPIAAAWTWVALNTGYVLLSIQFMHRRLLRSEKLKWYGQDVALPLAGSLVVGVLSGAMQPETHASRAMWLLFILFSGIAAFAASAVLASPLMSKLYPAAPTKTVA